MRIPILITISLCHRPVHQVRVSEILPTPLGEASGPMTGQWRTSFQWWKATSWAERRWDLRQALRGRIQAWRHFKMRIAHHQWLLFLICKLFSKFHTTIKSISTRSNNSIINQNKSERNLHRRLTGLLLVLQLVPRPVEIPREWIVNDRCQLFGRTDLQYREMRRMTIRTSTKDVVWVVQAAQTTPLHEVVEPEEAARKDRWAAALVRQEVGGMASAAKRIALVRSFSYDLCKWMKRT